MSAVLEMTGVEKSYAVAGRSVPVLSGVDLRLEAGATLALTGESGSGKSTLMHLAAGLEPASGGRITVAGQEVTGMGDAARAALRRSTLAVVFQQFNLIPSLKVAANIAFQARLAGRQDPALEARLAERLGLTPHLHKYPEALSGGQQQRVAIARALAAQPKLLLADEPTGNLDEATAEAVLDEMLDLTHAAGAALLMVTHSPRLAGRMQQRVHLQGGHIA